MNDYKDRIGEPVRGLLASGQYVYGVYDGEERTIKCKTTTHGILIRTNPEKCMYCKEIEFLIPSVFRHYGKRAYVKNTGGGCERVQTIVATGNNGTCFAVDDLELFERGCKCLLFDHYELIENP